MRQLVTFDAAVVGGGPSGSIAAMNLSRAGLRVVLLEKEKFPRYKACGGVVATHVDNILDFSIEPVVERKIDKILITTNFKNPFTTRSPHPFVYLVMRDSFDQFLVDKARNSGTYVLDECPFTGLTKRNGSYNIETPRGMIHARYLIGADGANGITRKLVGAPRFNRLSVAIEREIQASPEHLGIWEDTIALDFGYLSSGFAWIFPKSSNFSVGTGGPKSVAKKLVPYYKKFVQYYKDKIGNNEPYRSSGHYLPIRELNECIRYERTLLVGDAAGLIEPLTGEGIYYGIRSAQMAARVILQAIENGDEALLEYQRMVDLEIQPELQIAKSILYILDLSPQILVPLLLQPDSFFWKFVYQILSGEKEYQDFPRKSGYIGKAFFAFLDNKFHD